MTFYIKQTLWIAGMVLLTGSYVFSQDKKEKAAPKEKKSLLDKVSAIPDALIAQKEVVDTNAGRFVQDILSIEVPPVWKEKGNMLLNDLKLMKADKDPIVGTLPLPEKKILQSVTITLNSIKKPLSEKKAMVMALVKNHLVTLNKETAKGMTAAEMDEQAKTMMTGPESFTTAQGRVGELYLIHDIQTQQSNFIVLLMIPAAVPNTVHFAQIQYTRFNYETTAPDDVMDWKTFVYPDEQQTYVEFTKKMLKTLVIR